MKKLLISLLLALGINHAANLAKVQALDAQSSAGDRNASAYQLVEEDRRVLGDRERRPGQPEHTKITGEHEPNPAFANYGRGRAGASPYEALARAASSKRQVDNCPCGPDCKCPDPMVCKNGDCKKNYIIFFSAEWCRPCQRMYPRIDELRKAGYIVYVLDVDKYKATAESFSIGSLPTTVVMDKGKETNRYIGIVDKSTITDVTKTRDEQKKDAPCDYNFR